VITISELGVEEHDLRQETLESYLAGLGCSDSELYARILQRDAERLKSFHLNDCGKRISPENCANCKCTLSEKEFDTKLWILGGSGQEVFPQKVHSIIYARE
jgi:hypothetical protein